MRIMTAFVALAVIAGAQESPYQSPWDLMRGEHDKNKDGKVSRAEYTRGEVRFGRLDRDADGFITEADMAGAGRRRGGGGGGGRGGRGAAPTMTADKRTAVMLGRLLGADEEVTLKALDAWFKGLDSNGDGKLAQGELTCVSDTWARLAVRRLDGDNDSALSKGELVKAYGVADADKSGTLSVQELAAPTMRRRGGGGGGRRARGNPPAVGEIAPDFTLKTLDGKTTHTLSSYKGKKPVALIFGSYT